MPIMEKDENEGDAFAYYFWAIAIFFFTLALINFIVLLVIAHVLEISPRGMYLMYCIYSNLSHGFYFHF